MPQPLQPPDPTTPTMDPSPTSPSTAAGAAGSGKGSSAGRFTTDAGQPFNAEGAPPSRVPEPEAEETAELVLWDERRIRQLLTAQGAALHMLVAVDKASDEWVHTQADLEAIAPPLTAILNRYPATQAAAAAGDELALVVGLGGYVARSYRQRMRDLAALAEGEVDVPVSGVAADPLTAEQQAEWDAAAGVRIPDPDTEPAPIGGPR